MLVSYLEAINAGLREEMQRDSRVVVLAADAGGLSDTAHRGLMAEFGTDRVIAHRLVEGSMVSLSIGAAMAGMRPVAQLTFADFDTPAIFPITQLASKLRYRSGGSQTCPVTVRVSYGGGAYPIQANAMWWAHEPGLVVVAPATASDAKGMLKAGIRQDDPVIYLEHSKLCQLPAVEEDLPDGADNLADLFHCAIRRPGKDATIVAYGYMLQLALRAAEELCRASGATVEVIDLRILNPLDHDTILESVSRTGRLCILQEELRALGIGSEIAATVADRAFDCLDAPIVRVAVGDIPVTPALDAQEQLFMLSVGKVVDALNRVLRY